MSHKDKELTLATSRLLQEDLRAIIARENVSWTVIDSGIVPPHFSKPPKAIFFIVDSRVRQYADWTMRQRYDGGKFFRIEMTIELEYVEEPLQPWARKYARSPHMKCVMLRGDSYEHRYSSRGSSVCDGIYGLLDTPECTMHMAEKIRTAMNASMATQAQLKPH